MGKKNIDKIVRDKYDHPDVQQHVLQSIKDNNTADKILSGELVLPSEADALRSHQQATGTLAHTEQEARLIDENNKLKQRLDSIESRLSGNPPAQG